MPDYTVSGDVDSMLRSANDAAIRSAIGLGTTDAQTFLAQTLIGQTLTDSQATNLLNLSTTWNTVGSPSLIYGRVTNTNSNPTANLIDLGTVAGGSLFRVDKAGNATLAGLSTTGPIKPEQATMVDKAASFTLAAVDAGTIINSTSATAITITLPATDMPAGYNVMVIQSGAGAVTIAAGGNTLQSFGGASATAGQHAACSIVRTAASAYNLSGNLV